jgi:very-short-patch-repair endonuclease
MLKDVAPKGKSSSVRRARTLRKAMTLPEILLWQALRIRPAGLKFRRQHPSGTYILDFYCSDARLGVEVDGAVHESAERAARDAKRDACFAREGIRTLRISAADVLRDVATVVEYITTEAILRLPLHHPSGGPPPRDKLGEE